MLHRNTQIYDIPFVCAYWLLLSFLSVCLWRYQAAAMELSGVWSYQQHTGNIECFCQPIMLCFKTNASLRCIQPFHGNLACFPIFHISCYDKNSLLVVTLNDASARFKSSSCNQHFSLNWKRFSYQSSHFQRWWCIDNNWFPEEVFCAMCLALPYFIAPLRQPWIYHRFCPLFSSHLDLDLEHLWSM